MNRADKQAEVEFLTDCFKRAEIAFCADYRGLTVSQITQLRKSLRQSGATGRVVKNTLARISAEKILADAPAQDREKFLKLFDGPSFLVFSFSDPVAPAKAITEFIKSSDKFKVKGGWLDNAFLEPKSVETLSKMPSREEVFSMLLRVIKAPATRMVGVMQAPGAQLVRLLEAHRKKMEEAK